MPYKAERDRKGNFRFVLRKHTNKNIILNYKTVYVLTINYKLIKIIKK